MKIFEDLIKQAKRVNDHLSVQDTDTIVNDLFVPMLEEWSPEECALILNLYKYEGQKWEVDEEPEVKDFANSPSHVSGFRAYEDAHKEWEEKHPKQVARIKEALLCLVFDILEK